MVERNDAETRKTENRRRNKERRAYLKRNHRCQCCGKQDALTLIGRTYCAECAEKVNENARKKYPCYAEQHRAACKSRYEDRKARGLCASCGKTLPQKYGYIRCAQCRAKSRQRMSRLHRERGGLTIEERLQEGRCYNCGAPAMQGFNSSFQPLKLCEVCYQKSIKSMEKARAVQKEMGPNSWQERNRLAYLPI